mmetsp:Transcript_1444/g.3055  ORF Transcript_1444/g.3055 Transcript_1444/m.3055 type:complete len:282 (-) Transcript_1444:2238-3083(-)
MPRASALRDHEHPGWPRGQTESRSHPLRSHSCSPKKCSSCASIASSLCTSIYDAAAPLKRVLMAARKHAFGIASSMGMPSTRDEAREPTKASTSPVGCTSFSFGRSSRCRTLSGLPWMDGYSAQCPPPSFECHLCGSLGSLRAVREMTLTAPSERPFMKMTLFAMPASSRAWPWKACSYKPFTCASISKGVKIWHPWRVFARCALAWKVSLRNRTNLLTSVDEITWSLSSSSLASLPNACAAKPSAASAAGTAVAMPAWFVTLWQRRPCSSLPCSLHLRQQ